MKLKLLFTLFFTSLVAFSQQIPEAIKPPSWKLNNISEIEPYNLPSFDLKKLQKEDKTNDKDKSKPWRFGHDLYVDHSFNDIGEWTTLENGDRIWRMTYKSEGAHTLNFMFDVFKLPEGAKLYVYSNDKTDLLRPFTHHNNNPEEVLGTWLVEGNQAWIEYYQPAHVSGTAKITVGSVVHGYRTAESYQKGLNDSGACNQDVDCDITPTNDPFALDTAKENVKKAAAMLVQGGGFCSGTLVNNTNNDGTPYFMTANHCGSNVDFWAFRFNWRSPNPSCAQATGSPNGSFDQTVSGAISRASSSQSDMRLVEITDTSFFNNNPDVVWSGWNKSTTQVPVVNFGIHHPRGDIQKVCREDDGAYRAVIGFNGNPNTQMWYIDDWELGVTEPGSSGSGLFNETGHLIGVLSGGAAACIGTSTNGAFDYYGRFDVAWDFGATPSSRLKEWLDPSNSGIDVLDQYPPLETFDIDARVSAGPDNSLEICDDDFAPQVTLINPGNLNLTSATINYYIDDEPSTTVNWTGNLANNATEVVANPTYTNLSSGSHSFIIEVSNPNETTDENSSNDTFVFNFEVSPNFTTSQVVFNILTDDWAEETTWELKNSDGVVVSSGPTTEYADATSYQETIDIPSFDVCYTFTIFDSANDGICCNFGIGSYNLEDENGSLIIAGADFGTSESVTFNVQDPLSVKEFDFESLVEFYPNPVQDEVTISLYNVYEDLNYEIFNTIGQVVQKGRLSSNNRHTIDMTTYQSGIYFVKLSSSVNSFTRKVIKN